MIIYEAYNKNNGKVYVGLTTKTLEHRRSQHIRSAKSNSNTHFAKAIRKWGEDSFEWSEIFRCNDFKKLCKLEQTVIQSYENWQTYNISKGGSSPAYGMTHSVSTKKLCGK